MAPDTAERGARGDATLQHDRARIVRRYLSALDMRRPGRNAARTAETINHRIHHVDTLLMSADPVQRLHLTQERIDLHAELLRISTGVTTEFAEAEAAFVRVVRAYSERHGITFSAWRQIGVDTAVLERGGIAASKPARAGKPAPAAAVAPGAAPAAAVAPGAPAAEPARAPAAEPARAPQPTPEPVAEAAPAAPAAPVVRDPSCLDELPPVPRIDGAKPPSREKAKPAAKRAKAPSSTSASAPANGTIKKAARTTKQAAAAKTGRPAKKAAGPVQQQLPADASS